MKDFDLRYLRLLTLVEGSSLLILLFLAMPLRWVTHDPRPVRLAGMTHGILFLMFVYTLLAVGIDRSWGAKKILFALLMGSLPFGAFRSSYFDDL